MLLLASDEVEMWEPGAEDGHGWREPPEGRARWCGQGNLQLNQGDSDPTASGGGGRGPHQPVRSAEGLLFLPEAAKPVEGWSARVRGEVYVLSEVRRITDPTGGGLGCWLARAKRRSDG